LVKRNLPRIGKGIPNKGLFPGLPFLLNLPTGIIWVKPLKFLPGKESLNPLRKMGSNGSQVFLGNQWKEPIPAKKWAQNPSYLTDP